MNDDTPLRSAALNVTAFGAANSRAYLKAVFAAWSAGDTVMAMPAATAGQEIPGTRLTGRKDFTPDPGWFEAELPARPAADPALIAFSSGTTGQPKAILLAHRSLQDVVGRINTAMGLDGTVREYLGVPVTYSFGFGRARAVAAAGGRAFLPEHGFDPGEIGRMLAAGDINAVSAVPTLWRVLLANPDSITAEAARRMRWIEIGSQWMTAEEKLTLRRMFPEARIVQHYGLTEASRTTLLDISNCPEDRLDSVGRATGETGVAIDENGAIRIRGPHLAEGLVTGTGIRPITGPDGWLTTSDRGQIEDGWLYYAGRMDELINAGGLKIDPTAFETAVNAKLGVPGAVAAGRLDDGLRGEKVLVALRRDAGLPRETAAKAIRAEAERLGLTGQGAFELREVEAIPTTATGKVRRGELAALEDLGAAAPRGTGGGTAPSPRHAELQALWGEVLGTDDVPTDKSFYDLGGDSLSALTAILRMETLGIDPDTARGIFDGKTIAEIAGGDASGGPAQQDTEATGSPPRPQGLTLGAGVNAVHATRGVLVLWVVIIHWLPAVLTRLGEHTLWLYEAMTPLWRLGTPGFALVFGIGIGALRLIHFKENPALFAKSTRFNTRLILGGVLILAAVRALTLVVEGRFGERLPMSGLFYSAITYYALAMLTLPLTVRLLSLGPNRLLTILSVAAGAMMIHIGLHAAIAEAQPPAMLEFIKITLTAKYGFFRMTGYVMIGVAIGWLFRRHHERPGLARDLALSALLLAAFGAIGLYQANPENLRASFGFPDLWHLAIYAGTVVMLLAGFARLNSPRARPPHKAIAWLNAFAVASGILALPIFVGHELVLGVKHLLDALGLPDLAGMALVLAPFGIALSLAYMRLMRFLAR